MTEPVKMTFLEHLEELRSRIIRSLIAVLVGMLACWGFHDQILAFLLAPLYTAWRQVEGLPAIDQVLNFSSLMEPFIAAMKIAAIGGVFVSAPYVLYQLWRFISPGLYARERRLAVPFVAASSLLFVGGSIMAYAIVFPIGFQFFLEFAAGRQTLSYEAVVGRGELIQVVGQVQLDSDHRQQSDDKADVVPPPEATSELTWYETLLARFSKGDCGKVRAAMPPGQGNRLEVVFEWHSARCGYIVMPLRSRINGKELPLEWSAPRTSIPGYQAIYAAVNVQCAPGATFQTIVPTNDQERKLMPILMLSDYLSFAMRILLAFGLIFELPVIICFMALAGIVNHRQLLKFGRWFIILAFVIGAVLTPPDVITQILLAVPLIALYYISVLVAYFMQPKI